MGQAVKVNFQTQNNGTNYKGKFGLSAKCAIMNKACTKQKASLMRVLIIGMVFSTQKQ